MSTGVDFQDTRNAILAFGRWHPAIVDKSTCRGSNRGSEADPYSAYTIVGNQKTPELLSAVRVMALPDCLKFRHSKVAEAALQQDSIR